MVDSIETLEMTSWSHEVISIESTISATLTMSRLHTIFKWHLAEWQSINERMDCFSSTFVHRN